MNKLLKWYCPSTPDPFFESQGFPNIEDTYKTQNGGRLPKEGELYRNEYLANTYQKIAVGGRDVFYKGEIAKTIEKFIKEH